MTPRRWIFVTLALAIFFCALMLTSRSRLPELSAPEPSATAPIALPSPGALPQPSPVARDTPAPYATVGREEVYVDFDEIPESQRPARVRPYLENGARAGLRFSDVLKGGLFDRMGIQDGDIVSGCSDEDRGNPFAALGAAKDSHAPLILHLCILREGQRLARDIQIR